MNKLLFATVFVVGAISGCSSTNKTDTPANANANPGIPLFGKLEKVNEQYAFTEFATSPVTTQPWVNLKTGEPSWNTETEKCPFVKKKVEHVCFTADEKLFREESIDIVSTGVSTVLSFGVLASVPNKDVTFEESEYREAIAQAGGFAQYRTAIDTYTALQEEVYSKQRQTDAKMSGYLVKPTVSVSYSGATELYESKPDLSRWVTLEKHKLDATDMLTLKANTIEDLLRLAQTKKETIVSQWDKMGNSIAVSCKTVVRDDLLNLHLSCPESVQVNSPVPHVPIKADIRINVKDATPAKFTYGNGEGIISKQGRDLFFTNVLNDFITVESISYYYANKTATISNLNISVPPKSGAVLTSLGRLNINTRDNRFEDITVEQAKDITLKYGIAVQYRVASNGTTSSRKLLGTEEKSLIDIVKTKLKEL